MIEEHIFKYPLLYITINEHNYMYFIANVYGLVILSESA